MKIICILLAFCFAAISQSTDSSKDNELLHSQDEHISHTVLRRKFGFGLNEIKDIGNKVNDVAKAYVDDILDPDSESEIDMIIRLVLAKHISMDDTKILLLKLGIDAATSGGPVGFVVKVVVKAGIKMIVRSIRSQKEKKLRKSVQDIIDTPLTDAERAAPIISIFKTINSTIDQMAMLSEEDFLKDPANKGILKNFRPGAVDLTSQELQAIFVEQIKETSISYTKDPTAYQKMIANSNMRHTLEFDFPDDIPEKVAPTPVDLPFLVRDHSRDVQQGSLRGNNPRLAPGPVIIQREISQLKTSNDRFRDRNPESQFGIPSRLPISQTGDFHQRRANTNPGYSGYSRSKIDQNYQIFRPRQSPSTLPQNMQPPLQNIQQQPQNILPPQLQNIQQQPQYILPPQLQNIQQQPQYILPPQLQNIQQQPQNILPPQLQNIQQQPQYILPPQLQNKQQQPQNIQPHEQPISIQVTNYRPPLPGLQNSIIYEDKPVRVERKRQSKTATVNQDEYPVGVSKSENDDANQDDNQESQYDQEQQPLSFPQHRRKKNHDDEDEADKIDAKILELRALEERLQNEEIPFKSRKPKRQLVDIETSTTTTTISPSSVPQIRRKIIVLPDSVEDVNNIPDWETNQMEEKNREIQAKKIRDAQKTLKGKTYLSKGSESVQENLPPNEAWVSSGPEKTKVIPIQFLDKFAASVVVEFDKEVDGICYPSNYDSLPQTQSKNTNPPACSKKYEEIDSQCFRLCRADYTAIGSFCFKDCEDDEKVSSSQKSCIGVITTRRAKYKRKVVPLGCGSKLSLVNGQCVKVCNPGDTSIGDICYAKCSGSWSFQCGAGCAYDKETCEKNLPNTSSPSNPNFVSNIVMWISTFLKNTPRPLNSFTLTTTEIFDYKLEIFNAISRQVKKILLQTKFKLDRKWDLKATGKDTAGIIASQSTDILFDGVINHSIKWSDLDPIGLEGFVKAFDKSACYSVMPDYIQSDDVASDASLNNQMKKTLKELNGLTSETLKSATLISKHDAETIFRSTVSDMSSIQGEETEVDQVNEGTERKRKTEIIPSTLMSKFASALDVEFEKEIDGTCWSSNYDRLDNTKSDGIKPRCPEDSDEIKAVCYLPCKSGYSESDGICYKDCEIEETVSANGKKCLGAKTRKRKSIKRKTVSKSCEKRLDLVDGVCVKACELGDRLVGSSVCYTKCSGSWDFKCGVGCAFDKESCEKNLAQNATPDLKDRFTSNIEMWVSTILKNAERPLCVMTLTASEAFDLKFEMFGLVSKHVSRKLLKSQTKNLEKWDLNKTGKEITGLITTATIDIIFDGICGKAMRWKEIDPIGLAGFIKAYDKSPCYILMPDYVADGDIPAEIKLNDQMSKPLSDLLAQEAN